MIKHVKSRPDNISPLIIQNQLSISVLDISYNLLFRRDVYTE